MSNLRVRQARFNNCTIGETQIVIPGIDPFAISGFLLISPNGRYGVFATFENRAVWVDWFTGEEIEVDLGPFKIPSVSPPFSVNQHAVANNGSLLIEKRAVNGSGVRVWSKSGEILLPVADLVDDAIISADGNTVAITARDPSSPGPTNPTYVHDLLSGRRTKFAQSVSMSEDGKTVAYLTSDVRQFPLMKAQAMVANSDGTAARQITNEVEGIRSALLSPDARYLYAVENLPMQGATRIRRYHLATGVIEDIPAVA